jgi:hypothetical protein
MTESYELVSGALMLDRNPCCKVGESYALNRVADIDSRDACNLKFAICSAVCVVGVWKLATIIESGILRRGCLAIVAGQ